MQISSAFPWVEEFKDIDFGDARLRARFCKLIENFSRQPASSFPDAAGTPAALEATYRFFGNSKVSPEKILKPHIESTVRRAVDRGFRVVIAHDTTALSFPGKGRSEIGCVNQGGVGFLAHFSLAIARTKAPFPLGVVGMSPFFRKGEAKGLNPKRNKKDRSSANESHRWWEAVNGTQHLFPADMDPIHVADREADEYGLFTQMTEQKIRFVIRIRQNRKCVRVTGNKSIGKLFDAIAGAETICEREVAISKRGTGRIPTKRKDFQPRNARLAQLHVSATRVTVLRPSFQYADMPKSLTLNCVHVREVDAPAGTEPVDWKLFTNEPIEDEEDVLNVVDDYRARWIIEEYFKALKTGCAYEKRQLENKNSLLNALAAFAPIAWQLLMLKSSGRADFDRPAAEVLTKAQIEVLRAMHPKPLPEPLCMNDAMLAIAAQGGHIRNNGPPGWQVLHRGFQKILTMEIAWVAAKKM